MTRLCHGRLPSRSKLLGRIRAATEVVLQEHRHRTRGAHLGSDLLGRSPVLTKVQADKPQAIGGESACNCRADTARSAGDEGG